MSTPAPAGVVREAELARAGFADPSRALGVLAALGGTAPAWVRLLADHAADPDAGLAGLARLVEARPDVAALADTRAGARLAAVLGASVALGEHLVRHPDHVDALVDPLLEASRPSALGLRRELREAVADGGGPGAGGSGGDRLRVAYRRALLGLAARDLLGVAELDEVAAELADLAGAALEAALDLARSEQGDPPCRLVVIGLGKCGGRELNYASDVDVLFVAEPLPGGDEAEALRAATRLASGLMRICAETTSEGSLWPVDAALRPEGKAGPLVRSLASHEAYLRRWAHTWELQALVKARPVAGDADLGAAYLAMVRPLVWSADERPGLVDEVQQMRRRVESGLRPDEAERELKLGPGGLRDVEFAVQLLQLVHGRADPSLRSGTTLVALDRLAAGGYVGRDDAAALEAAYRFLRTVEHRLQLHRLRRTHLLPTTPAELRRVGRSLGLPGDPGVELERRRARHAVEVRRLHEKLFYRPLLSAVARLRADEAGLDPEAAATRLSALGFADPARALRGIEGLTAGLSRRAAIQRTLLPVMLGWFAEGPDPDDGLAAFHRLSDRLGSTPWYLRLLRDEGVVAERLARVLASSRLLADLLTRAPEAVSLLARDEDLVPRPPEALLGEARAAVSRRDDWEGAVATLRGLRRRELVRIGSADVLGQLGQDAVMAALTIGAQTTLAVALDVARRKVEAERRSPLPCRVAVVAMGRLGGAELGYGSDADVLFVHDPLPGQAEDLAAAAAHDVAQELRRMLALPAPDPPLLVDANLRPEGRQGPLTRSLDSYARYYERWASVWEAQALLRARPVAGDERLGEAFVDLVAPLRYPPGGLTEAQVREIRRIKARVEAERLPRGADPGLHLKLGRGAIADVEWTVQLLQLRHAADHPALRTAETLPALRAAAAAELLDPDDAAVLEGSWRLCSRLRDGLVLLRARGGDSLPAGGRDAASLALLLGYPRAGAGQLAEDHRRATRRARAVVERVFYA